MKLDSLLPIFKSLQDETRIKLYHFLAENDASYNCQDLAAIFCIHQNVMREHLKTLEQANLVFEERPSYKTTKTGRKPMVYRANTAISCVLNKWNLELQGLVG
ncbi:ArsR/SmtB family transcription factor [Ammoniphilus resinae]|uniref:ArsR family transcriptional regulator n=1 Tax=Ammoniphilus resinae TaxID=861532 RepID=A0ABS4GUG9_9BACL|nr:helix-turn-helix domain-containing protein [Ammoniphilus resinae]MBP1933918.1 putative ArsR family transcriptional regulator [Ammoniphilus resinae]